MMMIFGIPAPLLFGQLLLGLINGAFYAMLSLGLAIIFGMLNIINFAHGALFMMGAFVAWMLLDYLGIGYFPSLILAPLIVGVFGIVLERTIISRLYKLDHLYGLLLTFGLSLVIEGLFRNAYGSSGLPYRIPQLLSGGTQLGFMFMPNYRGWVVVVALVVTTDGFLFPNRLLKERDLMKKKGFPQSYDMRSLVNFVSEVKSGAKEVSAPVYSHLIYDIVPEDRKIISQPDILILEGLNVLQSGMDYQHASHHVFVSDFVDFSLYVDAPENLLQSWYINRFLKFRQGAFSDPDSYFHSYAQLPEEEAIKIATQLWVEINGLNLRENILPTRERASLILTKSANHAVENIRLRK